MSNTEHPTRPSISGEPAGRVSYKKEKNMNNTEIKKRSIVKFKAGFYRVTNATKNTVNLGSIFGSKIYYKGIPKSDVAEAEAEWYKHWSNSETYRSM